MVSNDLAEFTCTMQKDTKKVVDQTKETLKVLFNPNWLLFRGGSRISGKGVHTVCIKVWGFALLILSHIS